MSQISLDQRVADMRVKDLQVLVDTLMVKALQSYELRSRKYFIDDEGWLCFRDEQDYAEYLDNLAKLPGEVRACFIENGAKIIYSDKELLLETLSQLDEIHHEIENGVSLIEHATLRERLGV
ncbi:MAG: hypothetical protein U9R15_03960 [Chloroflexota bacterium]|nr:hypothetical protein [Chloroflexota bacterium]